MKHFFSKYINNKYFYTGLAFVIWLIFFDQESLIDQYRLSNTLENLEDQKTFYLDEIEKNEETIYELENDSSKLETIFYSSREEQSALLLEKLETLNNIYKAGQIIVLSCRNDNDSAAKALVDNNDYDLLVKERTRGMNNHQIGYCNKLILFFYISIASVMAIIYDRNKRKQY